MNFETIKTQVKEAFASVDSTEFLQLRIKKAVELHRENFQQHMMRNPESDFQQWREKTEAAINKNIGADFLAIGIYLLGLDEFAKIENTIAAK